MQISRQYGEQYSGFLFYLVSDGFGSLLIGGSR
jgi:hypothetical protein